MVNHQYPNYSEVFDKKSTFVYHNLWLVEQMIN